MGLFSKLFGSSDSRDQASTPGRGSAGPTTVTGPDGRPVISVEDTFPIAGRGLVVTGRLAQNVQVGDRFEVDHDGRRETLHVGGIEANGSTMNQVATGSTVGLMLARPSRH